MKLQHILVPIDFSEYSDKAVEVALFLAEKFSARITLLHAIILFQEEAGEETQLEQYEDFVKQKEQEFDKRVEPHNHAAEKRGVSIDSQTRRGFSAADTIMEFAANNAVDLLVMGIHGRSGFKKWIYGSVTEKVVRLSPVPVLTTHHELAHFSIDKILVPVDFSDYSQIAVERAKELAKPLGASLEFLHVVEQSIHPAYQAASVDSIFDIDRSLLERVLQKLREFTGLSESEARFTVDEGKPHKMIKNYAQEHRVDLIVMATRGLTGLEHFLVGSNAERVVSIAPCPVLTVGRQK